MKTAKSDTSGMGPTPQLTAHHVLSGVEKPVGMIAEHLSPHAADIALAWKGLLRDRLKLDAAGLRTLGALKLDSQFASLCSLESRLIDAEQRLRRFSVHLVSAYEQTGRRIARDLHDEIGHNLLVLKLYLELMTIRQRVELLGGTLKVDSRTVRAGQQKAGTKISVALPLEDIEAA